MQIETTLHFLKKLAGNNHKDWFHENKTLYEEAKAEFATMVTHLIYGLKGIDESVDVEHAKECMFRINRDVRFSNNKDPYKTNMGAFMSKGGRKSIYAGYYIHLEPEQSFIGGGIYMPCGPELLKIRNFIYQNSQEFRAIIEAPRFKKYFNGIIGDQLKTAPKGFDKTFKDIDLLRYKHYAVTHPVDDDFWLKENAVEYMLDAFKELNVMNQFLNEALEDA